VLSQEDNQILCRVGPGTAMGNPLSEYWMAFIKSEDLAADGQPKRIRLLGEDLVAVVVGDRSGMNDRRQPPEQETRACRWGARTLGATICHKTRAYLVLGAETRP
jgi:hypothetical protein